MSVCHKPTSARTGQDPRIYCSCYTATRPHSESEPQADTFSLVQDVGDNNQANDNSHDQVSFTQLH